MKNLERNIKSRKLTMSVVGLGYVGLPLLLLLSKLGFAAIGIDKNSQKVRNLNSLKLEFLKNNPTAEKLLRESFKKPNFKITDKFTPLKSVDFIFITVDTPIKKNKKPDQKNVTNAALNIAKNIKKGAIIIVESTVAPTTTEKLIIPTIERESKLKADQGFYVAVCSERVRPNEDVFKDMREFPRVIGVTSPKAVLAVRAIYELITKGEISIVDCLTAEIVKTTENALRDVKIAFANEVALICESLGADVWKVRELVNKRGLTDNMLVPGLGVGGHCLPKDSWLLVFSSKTRNIKIMPSARKINSYMPKHVSDLVLKEIKNKKINPKKAKVLILGYSYIENCEDTRNSPSIDLIDNLKKVGVSKISVHDPFINEFNNDPYKKAQSVDCLVLAVKHNQFKDLDLKKFKKVMRTPVIFDCKNFFEKEKCQDLGFDYHALGAL